MGVLTALHEYVPSGKVEIIGFDRADVCAMVKEPLPAVQQPEQAIGQIAARYLLERIEGFNGPPRTERLKCRIVSK